MLQVMPAEWTPPRRICFVQEPSHAVQIFNRTPSRRTPNSPLLPLLGGSFPSPKHMTLMCGSSGRCVVCNSYKATVKVRRLCGSATTARCARCLPTPCVSFWTPWWQPADTPLPWDPLTLCRRPARWQRERWTFSAHRGGHLWSSEVAWRSH